MNVYDLPRTHFLSAMSSPDHVLECLFHFPHSSHYTRGVNGLRGRVAGCGKTWASHWRGGAGKSLKGSCLQRPGGGGTEVPPFQNMAREKDGVETVGWGEWRFLGGYKATPDTSRLRRD